MILNNLYSAEVDQIIEEEWSNLIRCFDDATIYQTWAYGAVRWGEKNISHIILKKDKDVVAAAQCRILKIPFLNSGIAYLSRGPMWKKKSNKKDIHTLQMMLKVLMQEYVKKRGYLLRIIPNEINDENSQIISNLFIKEGFKKSQWASPYRTIYIDLTPLIEELNKSLKKKWRENLNRAKRNDLIIIEGTDNDLYATFIKLYDEMHSRKKFVQFVNVNEFKIIQNRLLDNLKLKIMIAKHNNEPVAALVYSAIGESGITLFSATGDNGLKLNASYLLRWKMLEEIKNSGYRYFDQGGINPINNPGGFHFKSGMGGIEVSYIGQFERSESFINYLLFNLGTKIRTIYRMLKIKFRKILLMY